jgi:hypothetical protein
MQAMLSICLLDLGFADVDSPPVSYSLPLFSPEPSTRELS